MLALTSLPEEFDLQPDPRILPMLGEISLAQWRCLAEFIDNSIDAFLAAMNEGTPVHCPEVLITIPTTDHSSAKITVRDNALGMTPDVLEKAVRAGWSGNDPITCLGMFGMGFNIATARLGTVTSVWTTKAGETAWYGLEIDFDRLVRQRSFRTPRLLRPKLQPSEHGTEVIVQKLKPEQRAWFARAANRTKLVRDLARVYSSMLRQAGAPLSFTLKVNGAEVRGRQHCVWGGPGSPERVVATRYGEVSAYQTVNTTLPPRDFCTSCWQWLPPNEDTCPACGSTENVVSRQRRVHGWLGIQRYLSSNNYGVDLLRHGRKIEVANREDLFVWRDGDVREDEYPIDDPRHRGRIVGEIHLDHCRVSYMKDRFDRNDPAWAEMIEIVRGSGPLRPERAAELGYQFNDSPLFILFQAFRRSSPKSKIAGSYAKLLLVPDNEKAEDMAAKFHDGEPEYLSDAKWWELVEEADRELLEGATPAGGESKPDSLVADDAEAPAGAPSLDSQGDTSPPSVRTPLSSLTKQYHDDVTDQTWDVHAYAVSTMDAALAGSSPWRLLATAGGVHEFLVDVQNPVFRSATITPLDALLFELAHSALDFARSGVVETTLGRVLAGLRERYAGPSKLDPVALSVEANAMLVSIAGSLSSWANPETSQAIFDGLSPQDREAILSRMVSRAVASPNHIIKSGRFLEYAPRQLLLRVFEESPELFFDGRCWEATYSDPPYEVEAAREQARTQQVHYYLGLLADAVWLADQDPADLEAATRARLLRAALALDLLAPVVVGEER